MSKSTQRRGVMVTLAALAALAWLTLTPAPSSGWGGFQPPWWCLWCGALGLVDTVANILLFVPLGVGLRLLGLNGWQAIGTAFAVSVGIEAVQLEVVAGRDANVRDVLTNALGAWLGFVLHPRWRSLLVPTRGVAAWTALLVALLWVASRLATGVLLQPSPPEGTLIGQIAPTNVFPSDFTGAVHTAVVNGEVVSVGRLPMEDSLRARWGRDTLEVAAVVTARAPSANLASVVSVLTRWREEAFVLGTDGSDLVLRTRMRASDYQLRSPSIHLADVITVGESLRLRGAVAGASVSLSATSARESRRLDVALSAGLGWILVSPFDWPLDSFAHWWSGLLAAGWGGVLAWFTRLASRGPWTLVGLMATGALAALLPPLLTPAAAAPLAEWLGMATGALLGVARAHRFHRLR